MKKILLATLLALLCLTPAHAQQSRRSFSTSVVAADVWIRQIGSGVQFHQVSWTKTGTVSTCQVEIDFSNDGVTSAGTVISSQLCTSNSQTTLSGPQVYNYVRINVTVLSGGGTINTTYLGYTTAQPSGGGTTGCNTTGGVLFQNGTINTSTCNSAFFYSPTSSWNVSSTSGTDFLRIQYDFSGGAGHPVMGFQSFVSGVGASFQLEAAAGVTTYGPGGSNPATQIDSAPKGASFPLAATGTYRGSKGTTHTWRNNGNTADLSLGITTTDQLAYNAQIVPVSTAFIYPTASSVSTNILLGLTTNATQLASVYIPNTVSSISNIAVNFTLGDNSANVYDIGLYGPGCLAGATNVPLVFHIGPTAGTALGSNSQKLALASAPITNIVPGWYCFAYTSSGASPALRIGGDAVSLHVTQFANAASPAGGTGTTSSGTLNSTITAPAATITVQGGIFFTAY